MALSDLPPDCIALILSWTSPLDACRLASVCRSFASALASNVTWQNLLPSDYRDLCPESSPFADKRSVFECLARGVSLDGGRQRYTLLRRSGGVCRILSASAMGIAWGNDSRFWRWEPSKSSCFSKVAHLIAVCWLEVTGSWSCTVVPGNYSFCWQLKVANPQGGQMHFLSWKRPLRFSLSCSGFVLQKELDLLQLPSNGFEKWFEFEVGHIEIPGRGFKAIQLNLEFRIQEIDCSFWKGGLFLDCLTLRPSRCHDTIYSCQADRCLSGVRGRPGVF